MDCKKELVNQIKKSFKSIDNPVAYANYLTNLCTEEYLILNEENIKYKEIEQ